MATVRTPATSARRPSIEKPETASMQTQSKKTNIRKSIDEREPQEIDKNRQKRQREARNALASGKKYLSESKNLKSEIKEGVTAAIDVLYQKVKEAECENEQLRRTLLDGKGEKKMNKKVKELEMENDKLKREKIELQERIKTVEKENGDIKKKQENGIEEEEISISRNTIEELINIVKEGRNEMEEIKKEVKEMKERRKMEESKEEEIKRRMETTYATIMKDKPIVEESEKGREKGEETGLKSLVIWSKDKQETGDQIYEKIGKGINAKEEGLKIDRIRKAKDRKVILGCKSQEDIDKIKSKLKEKENELELEIEEVRNKDPLIIIYGLLKIQTDEDIIKAIKRQNRNLLKGMTEEEERMEIRYRRRARNPHTNHVIIKVSPFIWKRLTEAGEIHVDLQKVRVMDQSPLTQCSRCLGYGHSKRHCTEETETCSHCGKFHLKQECEGWKKETTPTCINCTRHKREKADHSAFSEICPIRRKWDELARQSVAYC
ncbi:hypothetical protein ACJJTC_012474 [Scirpophaga incertulas]